MPGLTSLAWRGLAARPLRTLLTVLGIALGVGVLFASLATEEGIERSTDRTVRDLVGRADLRVAGFQEQGLSTETLQAIRGTADVEVAVPALERRVYLRPQLDAAGTLPPPVTVLGIDPLLHARVHDLTVVAGSPLLRADEAGALVTERLAADDGLELGAEITIDGAGATERLRVVGIVAGGGTLAGGSGRTVIAPIDVAARAFGTSGVDRVDVRLQPGASPGDVEARLEARLTGEPYVLSSPQDLAVGLRASTADFRATTALIAAVALFVGAFLIFNTLSMTVSERAREVGLLRAAGATRRQVTGFILSGAIGLGLAGSLSGLAVGLALAAVMGGYVTTIGSVPFDGFEVKPAAVAVALVVGVVVTVAAALEPAWRAGRMPPIEALRLRTEPGRGQRARLRWLVAVFVIVALVGLVVWPQRATDASTVRALVVYGVLLLGTLLSPVILGPVGRLAGAPFTLVSALEERLARRSLVRDRSRSALTVGALTVGLAMIVALGSVAQHARRGAGAWLESVVPGDLVLTSIRPLARDEPVAAAVAAITGVQRVTPVATFDVAHEGVRLDAAAVVGADLAADGRLEFVAGDREAALAALDRGGATILPRALAQRTGLGVGDTMALPAAGGAVRELEVAGIVDRAFPGTAGETLLVGWRDAETELGVAGADFFAVRLAADAPVSARDAVGSVARQNALEPAGLEQVQGAVSAELGRVFALFDALALVAVVVGALGIVNALTMSVVERVREIGMLRAAGMTRRQVGRMVVVEAGIVGLVGAVLGGATGLVAGAAMVLLAGGRLDAAFLPPWGALAGCLLLGIGMSMAAAYYPARLAGRLSIVRAVQFE